MPRLEHVGRRRRRNRQRSSHDSSNERLLHRPHSNLNSAPRANLNRGAWGSRQAREAPAFRPGSHNKAECRDGDIPAEIDSKPMRFWRFSLGNAIVFKVLRKDQENLRSSRSGAPKRSSP